MQVAGSCSAEVSRRLRSQASASICTDCKLGSGDPVPPVSPDGKSADFTMTRRDRSKTEVSLDEFVPYLLNRVGIRIAMEFSREIAADQIKYSGWRVLFTLAHVGPRYLVELANLANFDISTLSRVVAGLEGARLIKRVNGDVGARNRRVTLTARGQKIVTAFTPTILEHEAAALKGFRSSERKQLVKLLNRMRRNLESYYAAKDSADPRLDGRVRGSRLFRANGTRSLTKASS